MVTRPEDVELQRLQLRFAAARVDDARAVQRLAQSIEACGQLIACVAVGEADIAPDITSDIVPLVLIDGYRRVAALRQLGRDTARVECWSCTVSQALAQVLARANARAFAAIEEALLLRELMDAQRLSQREAARQCGRDVARCRRGRPRGCSRRWRAPTPRTRRLCWAVCARRRCPRASCTPGSRTTAARSVASASAWSSTRGCCWTACASVRSNTWPGN